MPLSLPSSPGHDRVALHYTAGFSGEQSDPLTQLSMQLPTKGNFLSFFSEDHFPEV